MDTEHAIEIEIPCQLGQADQRVEMIRESIVARELMIQQHAEVELSLRSHGKWHPIPTSGYVRVP